MKDLYFKYKIPDRDFMQQKGFRHTKFNVYKNLKLTGYKMLGLGYREIYFTMTDQLVRKLKLCVLDKTSNSGIANGIFLLKHSIRIEKDDYYYNSHHWSYYESGYGWRPYQTPYWVLEPKPYVKQKFSDNSKFSSYKKKYVKPRFIV